MSLFSLFKKPSKKVVDISTDSFMSIQSSNNILIPNSASSMSVQISQLSNTQSTDIEVVQNNDEENETIDEEEADVGVSTSTHPYFFTASDWKAKLNCYPWLLYSNGGLFCLF